jgi:hypothetical protein
MSCRGGGELEPHMHRTSDLGICLCALISAGYGEGRPANYGHITMFSMGAWLVKSYVYIVQYL